MIVGRQWTLNAPGSVDLPFDRDFRAFWGDEQNWSGLLAYVWRNFDDPNQCLDPPGEDVYARVIQQRQLWTAATHLILVGLGWNDPCAGLRKWRESSYETGLHPILDFLWRTFGDRIEALEIYFGLQTRWDTLLALPSRKAEGSSWLTRLEDRSAEYEDRRGRWIEASPPGSLGRELFTGGTDPLHLARHVAASLEPARLATDYVPDMQPVGNGNQFLMRHDRYAGWLHVLYDSVAMASLDHGGQVPIREVLVHIHRLGFIGVFRFDESTERWAIAADPLDFAGDNDDRPNRWGVRPPHGL